MAEVDEKTIEPTFVNTNVIEDMISNLKLDIEACNEYKKQLEIVRKFISDADDRIQGASQALSFMTNYLSDNKSERLKN
jgi:hypothetical protein